MINLIEKPYFVSKSIAASMFIALGVYVLYKNSTVGPFLFAFGLLAVCTLNTYLFTGRCGYWLKKYKTIDLLLMLGINLVFGYIFGRAFATIDPGLIPLAEVRAKSWIMDSSISTTAFITTTIFKSFFCGVIMFLAVDMYNRGQIFGILFGIPLFIICGFEHCVANSVTAGIIGHWYPTIFLHALGNFTGSIWMNLLCAND